MERNTCPLCGLGLSADAEYFKTLFKIEKPALPADPAA